MAYETGGRADKYGNRFEYNWVIYKLLDVVEEEIAYVQIEGLDDDERGVDLWIGNNDGSKEAQQCKARNGSEESWTFGTVNEKGIFLNWKTQLSRNKNIQVSMVSPLSFSLFEDITNRARNTDFENVNLFYETQIKGSGSRTTKLFEHICKSMGIELETENGNRRALDFFSRMYYRQIPDSELKKMSLKRIDLLFSQEKELVYDVLLSYILTDDTLGKKIDRMELHNVFKRNGIKYRCLANDETIWPRLMYLNKEFSKAFPRLSCGLIKRKASQKCKEYISAGKSLIIYGNAGRGKSGCIENIIEYCGESEIPYIAIKLDKNRPVYNSKKWGEHLGLPASISHCINAVSEGRRAVIIMDQLDALRWTQSKSSDAISVCLNYRSAYWICYWIL